MSVRSDLAIGQLRVANNGNELLAILDMIANESVNEEENDDWFTDPNSKASYHHY